MNDEIKAAVQAEMRRNPAGPVDEFAGRIAKAIADAFPDRQGNATAYHGPHVVLSLDEARHALRCLPDDDVSESAVGIRSKVRAAIVSPPAFREPSA